MVLPAPIVYRRWAARCRRARSGVATSRAATIINPGGSTLNHVTTNDGVRLALIEKGSGRPLVLVPGWSQTAQQFAAPDRAGWPTAIA